MSKRWIIWGSLVVIGACLLGCQQALTAKEIVANVNAAAVDVQDAHAVLEISIQTEDQDQDLVIEVWEKRPDMFRAVVRESNQADLVGVTVVTNGEQFWMYEPLSGEVVVGEGGLHEEPASPRDSIRFIQEGVQQLLDTKQLTLVGEDEVEGVMTYQLALTPGDDGEAGFKPSPDLPAGDQALLWVDQERWIVTQVHFFGQGWDRVQSSGFMHVRSVEFNTDLDDDLFEFEIPAESRVIDVREMGRSSLTLREARAQADFLLVPAYVPDGTVLTEISNAGSDENPIFVFYFDHPTQPFTIVQGRSQSGEGALASSVPSRTVPQGAQVFLSTLIGIGDRTAVLTQMFDQKGVVVYRNLTWEDDGAFVTVGGFLGQGELFRIAGSLE